MSKLYYCEECKRVLNNANTCSYCDSNNIRQVKIGAPVNVIGTKLKGRVLKIKGYNARLLIRDEFKKKYVKTYSSDKLRKVL
ncbi:hypothetical protein CLOACE_10510 [Clostridium acetireducens DSM 10703]|jgi:hypothetical protein|uniref:Uncharacterized protein n=1 Tax=Clostridium acetireducens DSM 10703 TaxID=1121290 RepID=A0A1E8EZ79_9CLOT|nr:hypothetical protein [Clostridium acetireducens]OFI06278.1 hypothetical protein CLOACE_10510 [Clostridium acetireducens DSM 10703]